MEYTRKEVPTAIDVDEVAVPEEADQGGPPKNIRTTRRIGDRTYIGGEGAKNARLMFIETSVLEEEAAETQQTIYGRRIRQKPRYLKGAPGAIFKDLLGTCGMDIQECYFTAMCKWLLPRAHRDKPKKDEINWALESLYNEIDEVKPDIIVCLGKAVFDVLSGLKVPLADIKGAWFRSERFNCRLFPMDSISKPVFKPEYLEKFRVELVEVKKMLDSIEGIGVPKVATNYRTLETLQSVRDIIEVWRAGNKKLFSVDCEWGGHNHVDGRLRSIQFCWDIGECCCIKFRDETGDFVFDADYEETGKVLGEYLNQPGIMYVGHHFAADAPWMEKWLGLDTYNRCHMDTEFGQQCCDEYEDLGLERIAIKYTDLGRYDIPVWLWARANKKDVEENGYAHVPDALLIPYSMADVDVVFRATPYIIQQLVKQDLLVYFYTMFLPFVSNVFTNFSMVGLPMDKTLMDELRELFSYSRDEMSAEFRISMTKEANRILLEQLMKVDASRGLAAFAVIQALLKEGKSDEAFKAFKGAVGIEKLQELSCYFDHRVAAPEFNIRSQPQMRRWLFEVKGFTPIKTTNNKEKGMPSMAWEKVQDLPEERRKECQPSTDKQTLQILGDKDDVVRELLELNAVGNLCKAFLKEPTIDEDTGEVTRENGLHFWLCSDGRIHPNTSTTETARPRYWRPNSLNLPKWLSKSILRGIEKLLKRKMESGTLPPQFHRYQHEAIPSIRMCVSTTQLEPLPGSIGWCLVESDYQTAEVRSLGFLSGDQALISLLTEPDTNFAVTKAGEKVRIAFEGTDLDAVKYMDVVLSIHDKEGALVKKVSEEDIERKADGSIKHPKADLHWSLAERVHHKPREILNEDKDRGSSKVARFCIAEGEPVMTKRGPVAIQNLLSCDLLWDGLAWVAYEKVICTGYRQVFKYAGLWATEGHEVFDESGAKLSFGKARVERVALASLDRPRQGIIEDPYADHLSGDHEEGRPRILLRDDGVSEVWTPDGEGAKESGEGFLQQVSVSTQQPTVIEGDVEVVSCDQRTISCDAATMRQEHAHIVPSIQGARNQGAIQVGEEFPGVGAADVAGFNGGEAENSGIRQEGQQRALRTSESAVGDAGGELVQQAQYTADQSIACEGLHAEASGSDLHREHGAGISGLRSERGGALDAPSGEPEGRREAEEQARWTRVYTIVNAGPKHRYVCSRLLVANSSTYGATGETLERKIEADTGIKPEPGTGQLLLDTLAAQQPVATEFQEYLAGTPEEPGYIRSASGHVRHFFMHPEHMYGLSSRLRQGILSSLGRQAKNYPHQHIVAASAMRASNNLVRHYRTTGMHAKLLVVLYDAAISIAPIEERFQVAALHQRFMTDENKWKHHGRTWDFPIDSGFAYAWGGKLSEADARLFEDTSWNADPSVIQK